MVTARRHTERGFDRLVNFSDAVVAIAITLLVLPLIDLISQEGTETYGDLITKNWPSFLAFAVAFATTALFWTVHHRVFESIGDYDGRLLWLNMGWLGVVVLLPFISASYSGHSGDKIAFAIFLAATGLLTALVGLMSQHVRATPELLADGAHRDDLGGYRGLIFGGYFALLAVASVFVGTTAAWGFLGLIVVGPFADWTDERLRKRNSE